VLTLPIALFVVLVGRPLVGEEAVSPARAFLRALAARDATAEQRQEAWERLRETGKRVPKAVVDAIDRARRRGWRALKALIGSSAVKRVASRLRARIVLHQRKVRDVVAGGEFSREKLDQAMQPINEILDEAMEALRGAAKHTAMRDYINEMEGYAADAGVRIGWNQELCDTLCTELLVSRYVGKPAGRQLLENNRRMGGWIDPGEHACIARLNVHRMLVGLHVVEIDLRLVVAGKKHSEEMVAKRYFSHTSPTPALSTAGQRAAREHTSWAGECLTKGAGSGVGAFNNWYASQGHHKILINNSSTVGVGRRGNTWTLMMGKSRMRGAKTTKMTHYVRERYRAGDDPGLLFKLARWCRDARLITQAQDELERVIQLDPKHEQARKALAALRGRS